MTDRFHRSLALLTHPFVPGKDSAFDKIFIQSRVEIDRAGRVVLSIDAQTPTVALDDSTRTEFNLGPDFPIVADVQKQHETSPYWLISGGAYFWFSDVPESSKVILLQRDAQSATAGQWTDPAGRCDRPIKISIANEGHEELLILHRPTYLSVYHPVIIAGTQYNGANPLAFKQEQIVAKQARLAECGIRLADINAKQASFAGYREMPHEDGLYSEVVLSLGGMEMSPFKAICLFDAPNNTLELRRSLFIDTQPEDSITAIDGEKFNRNVHAFTLAEIAEGQQAGSLVTRPALGRCVQAVRSGVKPPFMPKP